MAMKDFDWKKFLLERGERVGLYVAGGIAVLLLLFNLFMPGKGFFSGSPSANANDLKTRSAKGRDAINNARPDEALSKVNLEHTKSVTFSILPPDEFRTLLDLFAPKPVDQSKRLAPEVLVPVEFRTAVVFAQVRSYMYHKRGEVDQVLVLRGATTIGQDRNQIQNL